ncbi:MAG TPA: IS630 family transposase [Casimicrobiaceae bacterium]|nr:IS630 family transposase [Casimicrobiaceae bacterium]
MDGKRKLSVRLSAEEREQLEIITRNGTSSAKRITHARLLLMADQDHPEGRYKDAQIAKALGVHVNTVARTRRKFCRQGQKAALDRKVRAAPPVPAKIDGALEAHLVAICCTPAPEGRRFWTMNMLADELVKRKLIVSIGRETVRKTLKKNELQPWRTERFCIPERDAARFVSQMERVLDVYALPKDDDIPLIVMDEASKELHGQLRLPLPMTPGTPLREDDKYERNGASSIFMFFAPLLGWRRATCGAQRTRQDWAREVKQLLTVDFPTAAKVRMICDNLNTHDIASLYATFPAAEAHALAARLEIIHTPRNGSWLNVAEIELSILSRQCLNRRIPDEPSLRRELDAWNIQRCREASIVRWQFTTTDARIKLHRLYPQF